MLTKSVLALVFLILDRILPLHGRIVPYGELLNAIGKKPAAKKSSLSSTRERRKPARARANFCRRSSVLTNAAKIGIVRRPYFTQFGAPVSLLLLAAGPI